MDTCLSIIPVLPSVFLFCAIDSVVFHEIHGQFMYALVNIGKVSYRIVNGRILIILDLWAQLFKT